MFQLFQGFYNWRWRFKCAKLTESAEELRNPARGWYRIYRFEAHQMLSREELELSLSNDDTLALVMIDIGAYRNRQLDDEALANIRGILQFFSDHHQDVILRVTYDHEGHAQVREPSQFAQVLEHLEQLGPVLKEHAEQIFVYQGMLVGNWGEMHASRYLSAEKLGQMAMLLSGYLTGYLAVRTPVYWRMLNPQARRDRDFSASRIGLFDDAIFGSDTHLGTFSAQKTEAEAGWNARWSPMEELAFEDALCQHVPQGGEALYEPAVAERRTLAETVARLRTMHVSYLNSGYDERLLSLWKGMVWKKPGPWQGMNGFDYIGRHLGYRFCVRSVAAKFEKMGGRVCCRWEIAIENTGFARCYQEALLWLEWMDASGKPCREEVSLDIREIMAGSLEKGTCVTSPAIGPVYLCAIRKRDAAPIYFANGSEGDHRVRLGEINH